MKKIFIIGISGSGKSTFAKQLSNILQIPCFDLDDVFWKKKYTIKNSDEDCVIKLKEILKHNNSWVIEGVYDWADIAANQADLVIWLNYGINVATFRVIKRWFSRKEDSKETKKELYELIKYVRAYNRVRPNKLYSTYQKHQRVISGNEHSLIEIKNKRDLNELLQRLQNN